MGLSQADSNVAREMAQLFRSGLAEASYRKPRAALMFRQLPTAW